MRSEDELEKLRQEVERLKRQNKELKRALLSSLDARIYSLLDLCGFNAIEVEEGKGELKEG